MQNDKKLADYMIKKMAVISLITEKIKIKIEVEKQIR